MFATFVVPAPQGCNLRCPGCAIAQRGEAAREVLRHEDYVRFLTDILADLRVDRVGIQGYEPLLPEAWSLTRELLRLAAASFAETSLVTNGTYLPEHARELATLLDFVTVSLNSAKPEIHDKTRGVKGAFAEALRGLRSAAEVFPKESTTVNSVLYPKKTSWLEGMPELLADCGVRHWQISPLINFKTGRPVSDPVFVRDATLYFSAKAARVGVQVSLSDELRVLESREKIFEGLSVASLEEGEGFFRLSPDASCARGKEALVDSALSPKWDRAEKPSVFLRRMFGEIGRPLERRPHWLARVLAATR